MPVRLLAAVAVGIVLSKALAILTHVVLHQAGIFPAFGKPMFDTDLVLIALAFHSVYAVISAYVTAIVAKDKAKKAVYILGTKEAILWVLGIILLWNHLPAWYNLVKAILGIPLALLGGQLYARHKARKVGMDNQTNVKDQPGKLQTGPR